MPTLKDDIHTLKAAMLSKHGQAALDAVYVALGEAGSSTLMDQKRFFESELAKPSASAVANDAAQARISVLCVQLEAVHGKDAVLLATKSGSAVEQVAAIEKRLAEPAATTSQPTAPKVTGTPLERLAALSKISRADEVDTSPKISAEAEREQIFRTRQRIAEAAVAGKTPEQRLAAMTTVQ